MKFTIIADKNIEEIPMKDCNRCKKLGREYNHPEEMFSLLKSGKRHTYCKPCRAEQTKQWSGSEASEEKKNERADYQRDYRNKRRTKVYHGNKYKRRAYNPVLPMSSIGNSFEDAVEITIEDGELIPTAKFDNLYFAIHCQAVRFTVVKSKGK